jgi:hypothetical protein
MHNGRRHWKEELVIDPPSQPLGTAERKLELDQTVDFAIQLLAEEAELAGWSKIEFLTAVMDTADARLATIEEEKRLDDGGGNHLDVDMAS